MVSRMAFASSSAPCGVIAGMMKSGDFQRLYDKWFNAPIPPNNINLKLPMARELRDNLKALSDKPAT